jgi:hypothetical protein
MPVALLLDRLGGVKRTGADRWLAQCPAHQDNRASLAVRELDDGRVLVHDFAGCSTAEVLAAIGLDFDALYPSRAVHHHARPERHPFPAADVLRAVEREVLIAATAAAYLGNGKSLNEADRARLLLAASRLSQAIVESRHA